MNIALISLAVLIAAILIGFFRKMNVGLIAILAVTIFASFISSTDKDVIKGFSSGLFIMLLGVSFLCAVGITNGSLELLAKKVLRLSGGHAFIAPIMLYLIGYGIAAIGPGCVPALGIVAALSLPLAKTTGYSSTMLAIIGEMGSFAGRFSPITPESALIRELAAPQGIQGYEIDVLIYATITTIILALATYFWFRREKNRRPLLSERAFRTSTQNSCLRLQVLPCLLSDPHFSSAMSVFWHLQSEFFLFWLEPLMRKRSFRQFRGRLCLWLRVSAC